MFKKYRKVPIVIEAVQYDGTNSARILCEFANGKSHITVGHEVKGNEILTIETLEGNMVANIGDYIIKGINGEFYPCKPDIFNKTYEEYNGVKNEGKYPPHAYQ